MTLHIGVWLWGKKYGQHYVDRLKNSLERNMSEPYQFHIWEPVAQDINLTKIPGCFARLRTFDPEWQKSKGMMPHGDTIVVVDLDLVVTGPLGSVFSRDQPFTILQHVNSINPCPYNGSVWALKAGYRPDVCSEFNMDKAKLMPWYAYPDDQAWFHHMINDAGKFGPADGIYAFKKPGWPTGDELPIDAKIVCFPGYRDPSQFTRLGWLKEHWR